MIGVLLLRRATAVALALGAATLISASPRWSPVASTMADSLKAQGRLEVDAESMHVLDLSPGVPAYWTHRVRLTGAGSSDFSARVTGAGEVVDHPHGLTIALSSCTLAYGDSDDGTRPACPGIETDVLPATLLSNARTIPQSNDSRVWHLDDLTARDPRSFLITVALSDKARPDDRALMGLTGTFGVGYYASGSSPVPRDVPHHELAEEPAGPTTQTPGSLPNTGGIAAIWLMGSGVALLAGIGVVLAARRRRR